jgi:two-component system, chemotaxis family, chemotaxis protein CheY
MILIVDDSSTVRQQLRHALEPGGYDVLEAENGARALALAETHAGIDLFIVDINMPLMDGIEMIGRVRQIAHHKNTPVFVLTTEASGGAVQRGKQAGATAWIVKPFKSEVLLAGIRKVLSAETAGVRAPAATSVDTASTSSAQATAEVARDPALTQSAPVPSNATTASAAMASRFTPKVWRRYLSVAGLVAVVLAALPSMCMMSFTAGRLEEAASAALGMQVTIEAARVTPSLEVHLESVRVGDDVLIGAIRGKTSWGSLFSGAKTFAHLELTDVRLPQQMLSRVLLGAIKGASLELETLSIIGVSLVGPLALPTIDANIAMSDGRITGLDLRGPDGLTGKGKSAGPDLDLQVTADTMAVPVLPTGKLSGFAMNGKVKPEGLHVDSWSGTILGGALEGEANVRWGETWGIEGQLRAKGVNAGIFASSVLTQGNANGSGRFRLEPGAAAPHSPVVHLEGTFTIAQGVLGQLDLSRAVQTRGANSEGRTEFSELAAKGEYVNGALSFRDLALSAGALKAAGNLDVTAAGAVSGRIAGDLKVKKSALRATLTISGTTQAPRLRL